MAQNKISVQSGAFVEYKPVKESKPIENNKSVIDSVINTFTSFFADKPKEKIIDLPTQKAEVAVVVPEFKAQDSIVAAAISIPTAVISNTTVDNQAIIADKVTAIGNAKPILNIQQIILADPFIKLLNQSHAANALTWNAAQAEGQCQYKSSLFSLASKSANKDLMFAYGSSTLEEKSDGSVYVTAIGDYVTRSACNLLYYLVGHPAIEEKTQVKENASNNVNDVCSLDESDNISSNTTISLNSFTPSKINRTIDVSTVAKVVDFNDDTVCSLDESDNISSNTTISLNNFTSSEISTAEVGYPATIVFNNENCPIGGLHNVSSDITLSDMNKVTKDQCLPISSIELDATYDCKTPKDFYVNTTVSSGVQPLDVVSKLPDIRTLKEYISQDLSPVAKSTANYMIAHRLVEKGSSSIVNTAKALGKALHQIVPSLSIQSVESVQRLVADKIHAHSTQFDSLKIGGVLIEEYCAEYSNIPCAQIEDLYIENII